MKMSIFSDTIKKYGYFNTRKAKLLAKAVKRANNNYNFFYSNEYWSDLALNLIIEHNIPTKYIPVRDLLACLKNGNLDLAIELYFSRDNEIKVRTHELVEELIDTVDGNKIKISILEEVTQLLSIIAFLATVKHLKYNGYEGNLMKAFLLGEILDHSSLTKTFNTDFIDKTLDLIVDTDLNIKKDVQKLLPYIKKIIPTYHHKVIFNYNRHLSQTKKGKALQEKFPIDVLLDSKGIVSIIKTVGFSEDNFIADLEVTALDGNYSENTYDSTLSISQVINKKINKFYDTVSGSFKKDKNNISNTQKISQKNGDKGSFKTSWFSTTQIKTRELTNDGFKNTLDNVDKTQDLNDTNLNTTSTENHNLKVSISDQNFYIPFKKHKKIIRKIACTNDDFMETQFNITGLIKNPKDYGSDSLTLTNDLDTGSDYGKTEILQETLNSSNLDTDLKSDKENRDSDITACNTSPLSIPNSLINNFSYTTEVTDDTVAILGSSQPISDES